jgi:hypothetical protein
MVAFHSWGVLERGASIRTLAKTCFSCEALASVIVPGNPIFEAIHIAGDSVNETIKQTAITVPILIIVILFWMDYSHVAGSVWSQSMSTLEDYRQIHA